MRRAATFVIVALTLSCSMGTAVNVTRRSAAPTIATSIAPTAPTLAPPAPWGIATIDPTLRAELVGRDWHPGCPVPLANLRAVTVHYVGFDGSTHAGVVVLNQRVAADVLWVFHRLHRHRFQIRTIKLAGKWHPTRPSDYFDRGDVTSSFNCRPVTDGTSFSQHSYGWAIDINPIQNPYVRNDSTVLNEAALPYRNRSIDRPGMIHAGDIVTRSFARIGWGWGGDWITLKDYMHFSLTGR